MPAQEHTRLLPGPRPPLLSLPLAQSLHSQRSADVMRKHAGLGRQGPRFDWFAYVAYYLPLLRWVLQYRHAHVAGDVLAGVSLASFQIPLVMSLATSLGKLPPLVGLYSAAGAALTYAVFGSVPTLVVGPLPSSAVLYGHIIERLAHDAARPPLSPVQISAALSAAMSALLLAAGLLRCGFMDNVLSRSLLKGFVGAMGVVMISNQLAIQMGLQTEAAAAPHASIVDKWRFAVTHAHAAHRPTVIISAATLVVVLAVGQAKRRAVGRGVRAAIYVPELLAMVVGATFLSYHYNWQAAGVAIVGDLTATLLRALPSSVFVSPFLWPQLALAKDAFSTAFLCSVLGFFDSATATKALGAKYNYSVSSNRELVALGMCNAAISLVGGLPSFGALGRSKVNILAGAHSPLAAVVMGASLLAAARYFLPYLYYLPECVLSLSTTIIGITVLEEVPPEVSFFWSIHGYDEVAILFLVFGATIFWSVEAGVVLGVVIAVVRLIKHGTRSRIHILGRVPHTSVFRNADELIEESFAHLAPQSGPAALPPVAGTQQIDGVLVIKIPEPLNFANLGDLRNRLSRIERFGTLSVHPSQPLGPGFDYGDIKLIVFDCKGMSAIDALSTQTLYEIVKRYSEVDKIHVAFARVAMDSLVRDRLVKLGIATMINAGFAGFARGGSANGHPSAGGLPNGVDDQASGRAYGLLDSSMKVPAHLGEGFFLSIEEALRAFRIDMT